MVKATTAKLSKNTKKHPGIIKKVLISVAICIIAIIVTVPIYEHYLDRKDSEKFVTLKQDMQTLQTEFNKIDPGWVYSEGCTGQGGVFEGGLASSCRISLNISNVNNSQNKTDTLMVYGSIAEKEGYVIKIGTEPYVTDTNEPAVGLQMRKGTDILCDFGASGIDTNKDIYVYCRSDARKFYFARDDR